MVVVGGGVCKVIFMSNPTVVLCWGWGFDNKAFTENWHKWSAFGQSTDNGLCGHCKCYHPFPILFSQALPFLTEGIARIKKVAKVERSAQNLRVNTFPGQSL